MAFYVESRALLFLLNPRTASSAISTHLKKHFGGRWIPEQDVTARSGKIVLQRKHSTRAELERAGLLPDAPGLRCLTVVRNPFDSVVSLWAKQRGAYAARADDPAFFGNRLSGFATGMRLAQELPFSDWFLAKHPELEPGAVPPPSGNARFSLGCDHILRFERLDEDFRALCAEIDMLYAAVAPVNATAGRARDYRHQYDARARERALRYFRWDMETFGYEF
jgi:hypothetical protein